MGRCRSHGRPAPAREIHGHVTREHEVAIHTVITVLNKLVGKGLLHREKWDELLHYEARLGEEEFRAWVSRRVVAGILMSTIFLNHTLQPWGGEGSAEIRRAPITVEATEEASSLELARQILRQVDVSGEIMFISRQSEENRLVIPVERPGQRITVHADLVPRTAEIEQEDTGVWDGLLFLHTMPGPHVADIRGNWLFTALWVWLTDATVYLLLFVSASGVYLWTTLRAERRNGWIYLGAGASSFTLLVAAIIV